MFRGDAAHSGRYPEASLDAYGGIAWRVQTGGPIRSTPAVADGRLFVGSTDGRLYALDPRTGDEIWRFHAATSLTGSPAVLGPLAYVTDHASTLYALDVATGELRWRVETGAPLAFPWGHESGDVYASSPVLADGTVFFGAGDGLLYAVDATDGSVRWKSATGGRIRSTPAVADGRVVAGSADGIVYAFAEGDGHLLWQHATEGAALVSADYGFDRRTVQSSPAVVGGRVLVGARDGYFYALDADSGKRLWRQDHAVSWVNSSPAVAEGLAVVGSSDEQFVQAVDVATGEERWRVGTAGIVWTSPAVTGNRVVIAEGAGRVRVLDLDSGEIVWSAWTDGALFGSPVPVDGTIYVGSMDGGIYAFRADAKDSLLRAVFWDSAYVRAAWYADHERLRNYLAQRGFEVLDAAALDSFLRDRIEDHRPSSVVFALDRLPGDIGAGGRASIVRRYLDGGGSVVWPTLAPLLWPRDPETGSPGELTDISRTKSTEVLGVDFDASNFDALGTFSTPAGIAIGLPVSAWQSAWTVDPEPDLVILARDELGRAAAWRRSYGGPPGAGFTRLWGVRRPDFDPGAAMIAAEWRPRS
jgi:outer membrane protein assembly factor BamB